VSAHRLPALPSSAAEAARILKQGGIVASPTDTLYGLLAIALDRSAIERIYELKRRPKDKRLVHLIASRDWLSFFGSPAVPERFAALWPGPLTLVLPNTNRDLPAAGDTVAVRWPDHALLADILARVGTPLVAPSANLSDLPPARSADEIEATFPSGLDLILDGGTLLDDTPSTIVDVTGPEPRVLRRGRLSVL
jgi:L-threonylcarbamoyladenylate synthase